MADAEATLRALLEEIAAKQQYNNYDVQLKAFDTAGANYTSVLFKITLTSPGKDDLKLFAKVACVGEKFRSTGYVDKLYVAEQDFYNDIMSIWTGLQEKHNVPEGDRYGFPKFYGGNPTLGCETVVLEDLIAQGYSTYNRFKPVDWEYAAKSMEVLAQFHAFSFAHRKEYPEDYDKIIDKLKFELPADDEALEGMWMRMVDERVQLLKEEHRERALKSLSGDNAKENYLKYNKPRRHPILVHGDYRPSNLMHKKEEGQLTIVPVDYQTIHIGCPVIDLIYFVFLSTDEEFRAQYWDQLLVHYYEQLALALRSFDMDPKDVYPKEEFDEDMKEMLPYALLVGVMILPVITVEAENAPQMGEAAELDDFHIKPNEMYASRFRGLVNDLIRWDVI
ncbi:uncharacterized protein LOC128677513 [Plodia interpunctella]|uniref:uncharacterized protein LOC128677513 n=1 Tax=Plodia interpunctella TaxID=58824 RepID=UPI002367BCB1|nr:uncharacterized protein LOC128677513 [Plodia interpunctella]